MDLIVRLAHMRNAFTLIYIHLLQGLVAQTASPHNSCFLMMDLVQSLFVQRDEFGGARSVHMLEHLGSWQP